MILRLSLLCLLFLKVVHTTVLSNPYYPILANGSFSNASFAWGNDVTAVYGSNIVPQSMLALNGGLIVVGVVGNNLVAQNYSVSGALVNQFSFYPFPQTGIKYVMKDGQENAYNC